jgi:hypothetical protein
MLPRIAPGCTAATAPNILKIALSITILMVMPVIPKPPNGGAAFGDKPMILFLPNRACEAMARRRGLRKKEANAAADTDRPNGYNAAD